MRIWVVGRGMPNRRNNMLGSFELEQAQVLSESGEDVCYFGINVRSASEWMKFGSSFGSCGALKTVAYNYPIGRFIKRPKSMKRAVGIFHKLADKMIKENGMPDVIHVHYPTFWMYEAFEPLQKKGVKIVVTEHWSNVQEKNLTPYYLKNLRDFVEKSDALMCVSSNLSNSIRELTGTKRGITVVPNIVNSGFSVEKTEHEGFRFIAAGRMIPLKQFDKVVEAFAETFADIPEAQLTIAGNGSEYAAVKAAAEKSAAADRIKLPGTVPHEKLARMMASSDVLISYSTYETFCVPIIEAWACGKPVIASSVISVIADNPSKELGITVDCSDKESLKAAMLDMYVGYSRYDSDRISGYARGHFSGQAVSRLLTEIYAGLF